jgi:chaperonin GroES
MKKIEIIPQGDFILLKEEKIVLSNSKILMPNVGNETPLTCKVLAVGQGRLSEFKWENVPMRYEVGDLVLSPAFGGRQIKIENETYILIEQNSIMAKLEVVESL